MLKIKKLLLAVLAMFFTLAVTAQVTTGSISGIVKNKAGEPLVGASVKVTHLPTGSVYQTTSLKGGNFNIYNVNPGGPYKIETSFVGYETETKNDIFVELGDAQKIDIDMETLNFTANSKKEKRSTGLGN